MTVGRGVALGNEAPPRTLGDWSLPCDRPLGVGEAGLFVVEPLTEVEGDRGPEPSGGPVHVAEVSSTPVRVRLSVDPVSNEHFRLVGFETDLRWVELTADRRVSLHVAAVDGPVRVAVSVAPFERND